MRMAFLVGFSLIIGGCIVGCTRSDQAESHRFRVGIAYGTAGKRDGSYSESASRGIEKARKELEIDVKEVEPNQLNDLDSALVELSRNDSNLVIAVGFYYSDAIQKVAPQFPKTRFIIIDGDVVGQANVQSISFREEQGSFLVGALAGLKTKTDIVGVVVASDIPILNKFVAGYKCGARATNPKVKVERPEYVGSGPDAFKDILKGAEHARLLIARGADVIYQVAGQSGIGVIDAAKDAHVFAIGADSPQNYIAPDVVLTSMLKNVDLVVFQAIDKTLGGKFTPGRVKLGLEADKTNYVDYEIDRLVEPQWQVQVDKLREAIRTGKIVVPDDLDKPCPLLRDDQ